MDRITIPDVKIDENTTRRSVIDAAEVKKCAMQLYWHLKKIEDILGDVYDLDRLREIVQADRAGRLHIFPVKIGETVWFEDPDDVIRSEKIERHNAYTCTETIGFENSDIGKYVFFSREAAEAALKSEKKIASDFIRNRFERVL